MNKKEFVCTTCKTVGYPKTVTPGSFWLELLLWLTFVLPGIAYSVWRLISTKKVCPCCGNPTMIPVDTPVGQDLIKTI